MSKAWHQAGSLGMVYEDQRWQDTAERFTAMTLEPRLRPASVWLWVATREWSIGQQHVIAPALHALNAALVGVLAWCLGLSPLAAWFTAAVFAVHPLQTEAVVYLSARADVLAGSGVLLALALVMLPQSPWVVLLTSPVIVMALALAALSKESALVAVVLLPLVHRRWLWALGLLAALMIAVAVYSDVVWTYRITPAWVALQLTAAGRLLSQVVVPADLSVDADYGALSAHAQLVAMLITASVAVAGCRLVRTWPVMAIGLLWMIAVIGLRVAAVTPTSPLNAHQFYMAMVGAALCAGAVLEVLLRGRRRDVCPA